MKNIRKEIYYHVDDDIIKIVSDICYFNTNIYTWIKIWDNVRSNIKNMER